MRPALFEPLRLEAHELLDSGDGQKLERFGDVTLVRPDPQALWSRRAPRSLWDEADLVFVRESDRGGRFERGRGRKGPDDGWEVDGWEVTVEGARLLLRPTPFKHVGLFPEQATNWRWMLERLAACGERPRLLNLFGYTGAASVLAARAGAEVTHVDASKSVLAWVRDNAVRSGLGDRGLRVLLEDSLGFVRREVRRGTRYDGILLDPPHYGRGPKGEKWQLETGLAPLLAACGELLAERSFLCLSTYAVGYSPLSLANLLADLPGGEVEAGELGLVESSTASSDAPRVLPCGFCARWTR